MAANDVIAPLQDIVGHIPVAAGVDEAVTFGVESVPQQAHIVSADAAVGDAVAHTDDGGAVADRGHVLVDAGRRAYRRPVGPETHPLEEQRPHHHGRNGYQQ